MVQFEKHVVIVDDEKKEKVKFASKIYLRNFLEGGYHVLDESTQYCSDLRPTAKALWKPSIRVLELGILTSSRLISMKNKDGRATTDAYCVAPKACRCIHRGEPWVIQRIMIQASDLVKHEETEKTEVNKLDAKKAIKLSLSRDSQDGDKSLMSMYATLGVYTFDAVGPSIQVDTFCVHGSPDGYITGIKGKVQCLSEDDVKNSESDLERIEMIREKCFLR
ncbi:hypothetical protein GIB67_039280 [Kingdonia uniflora]|uniref:Uncharacterized protein n=1 Tax=Kingdonia uniflora TaxID=39325 RepID=A0A7J7MM11_9MAGN|nr:hypothetical protein GIB67_039280 [Kingdonia uniflora]